MKSLIAALLLAMTATATAQIDLPKRINFKDQNGRIVGTGVVNGNRIVVWNRHGELLGTMVINPDGSKTFYDPNGVLVQAKPK